MKNIIGRNNLCPCGSNKKYKKCCLRMDEMLLRKKLNREKLETVADKKLKFLGIEKNFDLKKWKQSRLLKDLGNGFYKVKKGFYPGKEV